MRDEEIVELFLKREEAAIGACGEKYGKGIRKIALNVVENPETVEECENDTYLQAWNLIPPNEPRNYLFPFLARIVRHIALDRCRAEGTEKRKASMGQLSAELEQCIPDRKSSTEGEIEGKELARAVSEFLKAEKGEHRKIFVRRYWYMDSLEDIAGYYGYSQGKIKSILFRMRKKLKEYLEKEGYGI